MRLRQVLYGIAVSMLATVGLVAFGPLEPVAANPTPGIPPAIVLTPGEDAKYYEYSSFMIGESRTDPPDTCRSHPVFGLACDAHRLKLNRSTKAGTQNFVILELSWDYIEPPTVAVAVTAVSPAVVPDLDLLVYRTPTLALSPGLVGGQGINSPERVAFVANQNEYDVVIKIDTGIAQGYRLRAFMSDELFDKPFEALDEALKAAEEATPDAPPFEEEFTPPFEGFGGSADTSLAPLPETTPLTDRQIRNLGFGIDEQLGFNRIDLGGGQRRDVVAVGKDPSGIALVLALLVIPLAAAGAGTFWLRRRRQALI